MSLTFRDVSHSYGSIVAVDGVNLEAGSGEILCLLGPSGSGKTTLLRLAAGLEAVQSGELLLDGEVLAAPGLNPPPEKRSIGLVFQDHVLYPHRTVAQNVAFGLHGRPAVEQREIVAARLKSVGLQELHDRYPHTLSAGQSQRVALARALATEPQVMLLDEPFASVDATLRRRLRESARLALKATGVVTVVVTHDPDEALELGDRIAFMREGQIRQVGTPDEIWRQPADQSVAVAFGESQMFTGRAVEGGVSTALGLIAGDVGGIGTDGEVDVVVRPSAVRLQELAPGQTIDPGGPSVIKDIRLLGDAYSVLVGNGEHELRSHTAELGGLAIGQSVQVRFAEEGTFFYNRG